MKFSHRRYLDAANAALPKGWQLSEGSRGTRSGARTFTLVVKWTTPIAGTEHQWLVHCDQPRHVLRTLVQAVEQRGFAALFDTSLGTYTSRVSYPDYADETVGLREALIDVDPLLAQAVIDSIELTKEATSTAAYTASEILPFGELV